MQNGYRRLWPFTVRVSFITTGILLVGLLLGVAIIRAIAGWPGDRSENTVLIGILILSLLPIALALLDVIIERGGVIEAGGVKIDFTHTREIGIHGITVATNIGVQGQAVTDSSTTEILDALKQATAGEVVIIDLEDGQAWWETRLLVLIAGAERLGKPEKIVFVGTEAKRPQQLQGWSNASDLLPCLINAHPLYARSLQAARAAASQWALVEPLELAPGMPPAVPPPPPWISGTLATRHTWMAFDPMTGLHNELLAEQLLQSELGEKVEQQEGPRMINLVRLEELFRPVLNTEHIELTWAPDRQLSIVLNTDIPSIAVTQEGRYLALVSTLRLHSEVLKSLTQEHELK